MDEPVLKIRQVSRTRDFARTTLRARHRAVVRGFAEAMFTDEDLIAARRLDSFVDEFDGLISPASKTLRAALVFMIDVLRLAPLAVIGRFSLFEDLSLQDRTRMLQGMETSSFAPFTLLFVALKTLMTMAYFEDASELASIGYPGPERERYKRGLVKLEKIAS